jgi:hypothetical protein
VIAQGVVDPRLYTLMSMRSVVSELADHPNRLLVTATPQGGETYAEVAHEAIFRRWDKLREWIAAERGFLAWRTGLEAARRAWQEAPDGSKTEALLMGLALAQVQSWLAKRQEVLHGVDREFIDLSVKRERKARGRARRAQAAIYVLLVGIIGSLLGVIFKDEIGDLWFEQTVVRSYIAANFKEHGLKLEAERALKPGDTFRECAHDCPEMVVVPRGEFWMGSRDGEGDTSEYPRHKVRIDRPFAVGKFEMIWDDWQACVEMRGCDGKRTGDGTFGKGRRPVINVSWDQAKDYVAWLSRMTGKPYRLLSEAEWEYAARGVV